MKSLRRCWPAFAAGLLALSPALLPAQETRLANVSALTRVGTGDDVLTAGFVIGGTTPKQVVIRAVGPTIGAAPFNVAGTLVDPQLTVFGPNSSTRVAAANDNWSAADAATFASVGAFSFATSSKDAALRLALAPGTYTARVTGAGGTTGVALVEVYDAGDLPRLAYLASRAAVTSGSPSTAGFVLGGPTNAGAKTVLLRAREVAIERHKIDFLRRGNDGELVGGAANLLHAGQEDEESQRAERVLAIAAELQGVDLSPLQSPQAQALMLLLAKYPDLLANAAQGMAPHDVAFYLRELAACYHSYYDAERILVDDVKTRDARVALVRAVALVLSNGLALLGVKAPSSM